jgi:hypothetical protein
MSSRCRLRIERGEALLDGEPRDLRALVVMLRDPADEITVSLNGGAVVQRRTSSGLLRVGATRDILTVEGNGDALKIFHNTLDSVAQNAEAAEVTSVRRHAHIEYLGEADRWRASDSFPLVIGADWPFG